MELVFSDCDYGRDFECLECLPKSWRKFDTDDTAFVWFRAYDTSFVETELEKRFHNQGYEFCCEVWIEWKFGERDYLAKFPAKDEDEAMRLLQIAADAFYNEEE